MADDRGQRAVVLGGSLAGLFAARVLAEHFPEVTVVDRDRLLGVTTARRGVPQGRHVHGLLARGQQILDELFPGFTDDARTAGMPTGDLGELRWIFNARRLQPVRTGLICISAARPALEAQVRDRVAALPNVRFLEERDIVGLVTTADRDRTIGVRVADRTTGGGVEELPADLVIDATGRGSNVPTWLAELGYPQPDEERVKIGLTYTSRLYRLPSEDVLDGDLSINPVATPAFPRGGFLSRLGNRKWILSLTGVLGDHAPRDAEGFLSYAKSLPVPDIAEALSDAEPIDDPVSFHYPASVRRHYERLDRFPAGLLVLGDAACSFNPVYGQGMTVAALEALTLREHLREGSAPVPRRFFKDIARLIEAPWGISAGGDLGFPGVAGHRPVKVRMANAYMAKLHLAATHDASVTDTFMRVAGLVAAPEELMRPAMVLRVLRTARRLSKNGQLAHAS